MARVFLKGNEIETKGDLPQPGSQAPSFSLVAQDLGEISEKSFKGRKTILNIFPSLDTKTCSLSVKRFHQELAKEQDVSLINISKDLPFAMSRFCAVEKLEGAIALSGFRSTFGEDFGVEMTSGPLKGLYARAVIILDPTGQVAFSEFVDEVTHEPDYNKVLSALRSL